MFPILIAAENVVYNIIFDPVTIILFVILIAIAFLIIRKHGWKAFLVLLVFGAILSIILYCVIYLILPYLWEEGIISTPVYGQLLIAISIIVLAIVLFLGYKARTKNSILSRVFGPPKE
jgi:hypothetical protein